MSKTVQYYNGFLGKFDDHFKEHFDKVCTQFQDDQIVMISLVGSQNYNLATETSDYDTKCCVLPSWKNIIQADQPYSHTKVLENEEHIDFTDFRSMMAILKKQNINFLEQLFSCQYLINETYIEEIRKLIEYREAIARYNPYKCVQTMAGIAKSKETRVFRRLSEDKNTVFETYGYHPKELMQLCRIEEFLKRYIKGELFEFCLKTEQRDWLLQIKNGYYDVDDAYDIMTNKTKSVNQMADQYLNTHEQTCNPVVDWTMEEITENIFRKYLKTYV